MMMLERPRRLRTGQNHQPEARTGTQRMPPIRMNLLDGTIASGNATTPLMGRDLELACAIALRDRPVTRLAIAPDIWPHLDDDDAINAFNLSLHRLRKRLGHRGAIALTVYGYRLGDHVTTDIAALEIFARAFGVPRTPSARETELLRAAYRRLANADVPQCLARTSTGERLERKIEALRHEFAKHLGALALQTSDWEHALEIAHEMIRLDECDESAWEIAIRAYLARDDRSSAMGAYRTYARHLARELGLQPSLTVKDLLERETERAKC
jgi:DNA-binding SARP family transcriptional activator